MTSTPRRPQVTTRAVRAVDTRLRLLEIVASAIAEHGYAGTSMSDLVRMSGLTRGAFYFHFDSKEALALAAFRLKQQALLERLQQGLSSWAPDSSAIDRLAAAVRIRAQLLREDPGLGCMRRLCTELRADARLGPQMAAYEEEPIRLIASLIAQAQGEGDIRRDIPAERMARLLFAALVGMDELGDAVDADEQATDTLLRLFMDGLRPH